jgi:hypothetical protein
MSPKEPLPILRPMRYLFPTRRSYTMSVTLSLLGDYGVVHGLCGRVSGVGGHAPWSSCLWLTSRMRIWGVVLLWWADAGVLSSCAESFRCSRRREWRCRGGRGRKVGEWWVVLVSRRERGVGGWCWRSVGQSASERGCGLWEETGAREQEGRQGRSEQASKQAVCQGERWQVAVNVAGQTSNAERVKGGERWQRSRRSAFGWLLLVMLIWW